jgi:hypothetical protein
MLLYNHLQPTLHHGEGSVGREVELVEAGARGGEVVARVVRPEYGEPGTHPGETIEGQVLHGGPEEE